MKIKFNKALVGFKLIASCLVISCVVFNYAFASWLPDNINYMLTPNWSAQGCALNDQSKNGYVEYTCWDGGLQHWVSRKEYMEMSYSGGPLYYTTGNGQIKRMDSVKVEWSIENNAGIQTGVTTVPINGTKTTILGGLLTVDLYGGVKLKFKIETPPVVTTVDQPGRLGAPSIPKFMFHWNWEYATGQWWDHGIHTFEPFIANAPYIAVTVAPGALYLKENESASVDIKVTSNVDNMWKQDADMTAITVEAVEPRSCPLTVQGYQMDIPGSVVTLQTKKREDGVQAYTKVQAYGNGIPGEYVCNLILTSSLK
ncbi:hypothetical protein [Salmonella enterica]|uniref:hypothetical protein n=1 Tax=Salmonella enterica TaxID=28901 RepID=UPI0009AA2C3C|nr:hypothetical protein [Salmonella enterica]